MNRSGPGIRLRLTLSYMAVLLIILIVLSLGIWYLMRDRVEMMTRANLDSGYETIETVIVNSGGDIFDLQHMGDNELFLVLMNGEPEYQTLGWDRAGLPIEFDFEDYATWISTDGRSYSLRRGTIPKFRFTLYYAREITQAAAVPGELAVIMTITGIFAVALSLLGGYFLAGRALSPVRDITEKAREISADNLSERLPVPHEKDEIGSLAIVFNETLSRLEMSFEQLRRFTADASHELRTPLTSIRSVGEVALRGPEDAGEYRESIKSMLEETERLTHLVDDLLILARGDAEERKAKLQNVDLSVLAALAADELGILAEDKGQTLEIDNSEDKVSALTDSRILGQALSNVLHNAIRYTGEGGRIEISTGLDEHGRPFVEIVDNGPGIPETERENVFERFYRLDDARTRESGGSGLGLAIARWSVESVGGDIRFLEPAVRGSRCRITLQPTLE